jgi:hypothetical protein
MKTALVITGAVAADHATDLAAFKLWKQQNGKSYSDHNEERRRFNNFRTNKAAAEKHNADNRGYQKGLSPFADMSADEWKFGFNNLDVSTMHHSKPGATRSVMGAEFDHVKTLPASKDWVKEGKVTPVKNQGQCGSCWSFSTTGTFEGAYAIKHQTPPPSYSETYLVDCAISGKNGQMGCSGGNMATAVDWVSKHGMCMDDADPYPKDASKLIDGFHFNKCPVDEAKCSAINSAQKIPSNFEFSYGYKFLTAQYPNKETEGTWKLMMGLVQHGPVAVGFAAESDLQMYMGGVYDGADCSDNVNVNHGVLLTGYGGFQNPKQITRETVQHSLDSWSMADGTSMKARRSTRSSCS